MFSYKMLRAKSSQRKAASLLTLCLTVSWSVSGLPGCGADSFLGLQDYQRDLLFFIGSVAINLLSDQAPLDPSQDGGDVGQPVPGQDGLACWDLNGNGAADPDEDTNGDGFFDAFDCRGAAGLACWDLNGNGVADAGEDVNDDGNVDVLDCRDSGSAGAAQAVDGLNCWDLNGNRQADPDEDQNGDGQFDALDCRGQDLSTTTVVSGSSGPAGPAGADGLHCWDLNGNGVGDAEEDLNQDGFFTALDCQVSGENQGSVGLACWDVNSNGLADASEDVNGDGFYNALDCQGTDGNDGQDGLHCWDLNENGVADPQEDVDGDGFFTVLDCRGSDGVDGTNGADGAAGADGTDGVDGADGVSCWDLNGNGVGDAGEDVDGDQFFTAMDCRGFDGVDGTNGTDGAPGADGADGVDGLHCWDTNGDGIGDQSEDINGDGFFTAADCRGADGLNGADGAPGADGADGVDGLHCWDSNGNGIGDPEEDVDGDGFFTALDCRGSDGTDGVDGANGSDGLNGLSCWDLDGDRIGDAVEDTNQDGFFNALDCQGPAGADGTDGMDGANGADGVDGTDGADGAYGVSCWDTNGNGLADPAEDVDGDGFFTAWDCRGLNGADGVDGRDGADGLNCWDLNGNGVVDEGEDVNGDGVADAADCRGADGADGVDGLSCWDQNGNGIGDAGEDVNGDGVHDALDCRALDHGGSLLPFFDIFIDDFFTVHNGTYRSLSLGDEVPVELIEEPALGPTEVVAFRTSVPFIYDDAGHDDPGVAQNTVNMRLFLWREGPVEDCFVVRLDGYRARHNTGVTKYGETRYLKLDDPIAPDPAGVLVVVDLPLNNETGGTTGGLELPADLRAGDFLAFELNIDPNSSYDRDVSYTFMGVEFFETPAGWTSVDHATVFAAVDDVDCHFRVECRNNRDCDDGFFCNGEETCDEGVCVAGEFPCEETGEMCDEVDQECVSCASEDEGTVATLSQDDKSIICHVPQGAPGKSRTLVVSSSSVDAHLAHGDSLGACAGTCGGCDETVLLRGEGQGEGCSSSTRPTGFFWGAPARWTLSARSGIDQTQPTNPDASGAVATVVIDATGAGVADAQCAGSAGISGEGGAQDEELILTFDEPVRASDLTLGLGEINFIFDEPVLFLSSVDSAGYDYVLQESEIQGAFRVTGFERGRVDLLRVSQLPADLAIDGVKIRETQGHIELDFVHSVLADCP